MAKLNYTKLVPPDTFIGRYMAAMDVIETPHAFDFWCAVFLMSLAVQRDVQINRPGAPVFMNLFLLLCADSGIARKGAAVRHVERIANAYRLEHSPSLDLVSAKSSPEKFVRRLCMLTDAYGSARQAIIVPELVTFLGRDSYTLTLPAILTDLYDCPEYRAGHSVYETSKGELKNVWLSMLCASAPSWLKRAINPDVIEGGFTSRTLFIIEDGPKRRIAFPEKVQLDDRQILNELRDIAQRAVAVQRTCGGIQLHDSARRKFTDWYRTRRMHGDQYRSSFEAREDHHVLRLAGFLAINDGSYVISTSHITTASRVIHDVKERTATLFLTKKQELPTLDSTIQRLIDYIVKAGSTGVRRGEITRHMQKGHSNRLYADAIGRALELMHDLRMVDKFQVEFKPNQFIEMWRATNLIIQPKLIRVVTERFAASA